MKDKFLLVRSLITKIAAERKDTTPRILDRCAADVQKNQGFSKEKAYRICSGSLQKHGYIRKGTNKLTQKGRESPASHKPPPAGCR